MISLPICAKFVEDVQSVSPVEKRGINAGNIFINLNHRRHFIHNRELYIFLLSIKGAQKHIVSASTVFTMNSVEFWSCPRGDAAAR